MALRTGRMPVAPSVGEGPIFPVNLLATAAPFRIWVARPGPPERRARGCRQQLLTRDESLVVKLPRIRLRQCPTVYGRPTSIAARVARARVVGPGRRFHGGRYSRFRGRCIRVPTSAVDGWRLRARAAHRRRVRKPAACFRRLGDHRGRSGLHRRGPVDRRSTVTVDRSRPSDAMRLPAEASKVAAGLGGPNDWTGHRRACRERANNER